MVWVYPLRSHQTAGATTVSDHLPWFQEFLTDSFADDIGLSLEEQGALYKLRRVQWRDGFVTADEGKLALLFGVGARKTKALIAVVLKHFDRTGRGWVCKRWEVQKKKAIAAREGRRKGALKTNAQRSAQRDGERDGERDAERPAERTAHRTASLLLPSSLTLKENAAAAESVRTGSFQDRDAVRTTSQYPEYPEETAVEQAVAADIAAGLRKIGIQARLRTQENP